MKHTLLSALLAIVGLSAFANETSPVKGTVVRPTDKNIQYTGRISFANPNRPAFNYPGVQVITAFEGTSLRMMAKPRSGYFMAQIDGGEPFKVAFRGERDSVVTLATALPDGRHTVRLMYAIEGFEFFPEFWGFVLDKGKRTLPPSPLPTRKIEFIGNSITCGYGNEGTRVDEHFEYETENHYYSYAAIAARNLEAQHWVVARSGIGAYRNYGEDKSGSPRSCMPVQYEYIGYAYDPMLREQPTFLKEKWDFSRYQPDVVCINLGTNDLSTNNYDLTLLKQGYKKLLKMVRQHNPHAKIVFLCGSMLKGRELELAKQLMDEVTAEAQKDGDKEVYRFDFTPMTGDLGIGNDWHPSLGQHERMANELTGYLSKLMKWSSQNTSGEYELKCGDVKMTVDAEKGGKILSLKYRDRETLSQSRWPESFGSTFWTSPQKEWNWPPVPEFDKMAYTVEHHDEGRLVMRSQVSQRLGFSVGKDFRVDTNDGSFVMTYTIRNEGSEPRSVAPWEITRVANGDGIIFFDAPADSIWPAGLMTFKAAHGAAWYSTDEAQQNRKVNANGQGWLAYSADGLLLVKKFQDLQPGQPAPGEAEIQVYVNRGKTYIELESQGAYTLLQPGEQLRWTVRWYLQPTDNVPQPSESLIKQVKRIVNRNTAAAQPRHQRRQAFMTDTVMAHDPVMAYEDGKYYLLSTGMGISWATSEDRKTWEVQPTPFLKDIPQWTHDSVPGFRNHVWAPDIIRKDGLWWLAYSCSTFGKNTSAIGLMASQRLNGPWRDCGPIVCSREGRDQWNAIDPCFIIDEKGTPWMTWGSFWDGIQIAQLDHTMHLASPPKTIARRYARGQETKEPNPTSAFAGPNAIEAPFIFRHGDYYYLLASWDYCCRGAKSNYRVAVGRSKSVTGPYVDRNGKDMLKGGGTILVEGDKREFEALGHCAAYHFGTDDIFISHGYSATMNGAALLVQRNIQWTKDGWPAIVL